LAYTNQNYPLNLNIKSRRCEEKRREERVRGVRGGGKGKELVIEIGLKVVRNNLENTMACTCRSGQVMYCEVIPHVQY
jgi:hypothetical protein